MDRKNMIEFVDTNVVSYQELSAKLYSYCAKECEGSSDYKIVFFHSEHDTGKGNAVIKLFKQFAAFPVDVPVSKDCHEIFEMSEITGHQGTTLVICALPIYPAIDDSVQTDNKKIKYFPQTLSAMMKLHATSQSNSVEHQIQNTIDDLSEKTSAFNELLSRNSGNLSGNVIFLSGLTVLVGNEEKAAFPETALIPWNLTTINRKGDRRTFEQPDLNRFLEGLEISSPQIENLDRLLEEAD